MCFIHAAATLKVLFINTQSNYQICLISILDDAYAKDPFKQQCIMITFFSNIDCIFSGEHFKSVSSIASCIKPAALNTSSASLGYSTSRVITTVSSLAQRSYLITSIRFSELRRQQMLLPICMVVRFFLSKKLPFCRQVLWMHVASSFSKTNICRKHSFSNLVLLTTPYFNSYSKQQNQSVYVIFFALFLSL